jgi:hypothetical protein
MLSAELIGRSPEVQVSPRLSRTADTIRRTVHAQAQAQAQIINDLLDLSRLQTGKLTPSRSPVKWRPIIERITDALRKDAQTKQIALAVEAEDPSIFADVVRVEQIFRNLVSNTLKFTPPGGTVPVRDPRWPLGAAGGAGQRMRDRTELSRAGVRHVSSGRSQAHHPARGRHEDRSGSGQTSGGTPWRQRRSGFGRPRQGRRVQGTPAVAGGHLRQQGAWLPTGFAPGLGRTTLARNRSVGEDAGGAATRRCVKRAPALRALPKG